MSVSPTSSSSSVSPRTAATPRSTASASRAAPTQNSNSLGGFNAGSAVTYYTLYNATSPVGGSFNVRASSFSTMLYGVTVFGDFNAVHVTIGGSPAAGNRIDDVATGLHLGGPSAVFDVSYNRVSADNITESSR